jgi:hypothetical protein
MAEKLNGVFASGTEGIDYQEWQRKDATDRSAASRRELEAALAEIGEGLRLLGVSFKVADKDDPQFAGIMENIELFRRLPTAVAPRDAGGEWREYRYVDAHRVARAYWSKSGPIDL